MDKVQVKGEIVFKSSIDGKSRVEHNAVTNVGKQLIMVATQNYFTGIDGEERAVMSSGIASSLFLLNAPEYELDANNTVVPLAIKTTQIVASQGGSVPKFLQPKAVRLNGNTITRAFRLDEGNGIGTITHIGYLQNSLSSKTITLPRPPSSLQGAVDIDGNIYTTHENFKYNAATSKLDKYLGNYYMYSGYKHLIHDGLTFAFMGNGTVNSSTMIHNGTTDIRSQYTFDNSTIPDNTVTGTPTVLGYIFNYDDRCVMAICSASFVINGSRNNYMASYNIDNVNKKFILKHLSSNSNLYNTYLKFYCGMFSGGRYYANQYRSVGGSSVYVTVSNTDPLNASEVSESYDTSTAKIEGYSISANASNCYVKNGNDIFHINTKSTQPTLQYNTSMVATMCKLTTPYVKTQGEILDIEYNISLV